MFDESGRETSLQEGDLIMLESKPGQRGVAVKVKRGQRYLYWQQNREDHVRFIPGANGSSIIHIGIVMAAAAGRGANDGGYHLGSFLVAVR
ncbi:hypothetical protein GF382_00730 [Candidatus Falkowbacteria bacterium]|nr:hypothetical protein [Candidatus Falkowbacteria bacterium]